jgi:aspartate-semialdehyde dehydrogenase
LDIFSFTWQAVSGKGKAKEVLEQKARLFTTNIQEVDFDNTELDVK